MGSSVAFSGRPQRAWSKPYLWEEPVNIPGEEGRAIAVPYDSSLGLSAINTYLILGSQIIIIFLK